jgi:hypothetical protein
MAKERLAQLLRIEQMRIDRQGQDRYRRPSLGLVLAADTSAKP